MIYQTDPELQFDAKSDCYVFCILKIHELVGRHEFLKNHVNQLRKVSVRTEYIGEDGYLNAKGISGLAAVASGLTGQNVYIKRVSPNDDFNFLIAQYARNLSSGKLVTHFVLVDVLTHSVIFDPWSKEGARTTKIGNVTGQRHIWAEAI